MLIGGGGGEGYGTIPGDPGGIRAAAGRIGALAGSIGEAGSRARSAAAGVVGSGWVGGAADNFGATINKLSTVHEDIHYSLSGVASALTSFASVLEDCQKQLAHANALQSQAETDAQTATSHVDSLYPTSSNDPHTAQQRTAALASISQSLNDQTGTASRLANDAINRHRMAVTSLVNKLSHAQNDGGHATSTLEGIGDAMGIPNTVLAGLATVLLARSAGRFASTGSAVSEAIAREFDSVVGPTALAYDRGEVTLDQLGFEAEGFLRNSALARDMFRNDAETDLITGGVDSLGRASGAASWLARGAGVLGIAGDVWTFEHPDEGGGWGTAERTVSVVNGVATAGNLAVDGFGLAEAGSVFAAGTAVSWVPVAGQVVVVGTGLFLAGDYLYTHEAWFRNGVDATGHFFKSVGTGIYDEGKKALDGVEHGLSAAANFLGL